MAKGYIIEANIAAKNIEALNRTAVCESDVDGGTLVTLGAFADGAFTATKSSSGEGLYMAYNPAEHLTEVDGEVYAGLSKDPRKYTNLKNRPFSVFKPQIGDIIVFTDGNLASGQTPEKDKFLEQGATGLEKKETATEATTSFKVLEIGVLQFPQKGIGMENAKKYVCECVNN